MKNTRTNWSIAMRDILVLALIGAVVGTLAGFVLLWVDVVDNPFWATAIGTFVGAMASTTRLKSWTIEE